MADYTHKGTHQGPTHEGPTSSQVIAVATLLPVTGTLLGLAGLTLVGTLIAFAVATPLFIIFSPVLVPAALATGLAVAAILASGAFGVAGMRSVSRAFECLREEVPEQVELARRRAAEVAAYAGQKTEEAGRKIQHKAVESGGRA